MKKSCNIAAQFGLTHEEMARLMGVSRSLWSLYECGKRNLPTASLQLLAEMQNHLNSRKKDAELNEKELPERRTKLERLLKENEFQQLLTSKAIARFEKKQQATLNRARTIEFLEGRRENKNSGLSSAFMPAAHKGNKTLTRNTDIVELEIREELLVLEKQLLESKLLLLSK